MGIALAARLIIALAGHGGDLDYFMRAADHVFKGNCPYTHVIGYAYTPIYLIYMIGVRFITGGQPELFTYIAKLPQIFCDTAIGWALFSIVRNHLADSRKAFLTAILYLFNPIFIYNSAYYGRFDQFCVFFALCALLTYKSPAKSSLHLAVAFCIKSFTIFFMPYFIQKDRKRFVISGICFSGVLLIVSLPFLIVYKNPAEMFSVMFKMTGFRPQGLSWQVAFYRFMDVSTMIKISEALLTAHLLFILLFPKRDFLSFTAMSLTMFLFFSKLVFDQYITWALPFLYLDYVINKKKHALAATVFLTISAMLNNGHFLVMKMLGLPRVLYNFGFAGFLVCYAALEFKWILKNGGGWSFAEWKTSGGKITS